MNIIKEGIEDGKYTAYYPDGKLKGIVKFKDGKYHGELSSYYPNGQIKRTESYKDGKKDGPSILYGSSNGETAMQITNYVDGKQFGKTITYHLIDD